MTASNTLILVFYRDRFVGQAHGWTGLYGALGVIDHYRARCYQFSIRPGALGINVTIS